MGFYRKSYFNFLNDTSKFAPQAVIDHIFEGTSLASFRYQVRLGVGIHTNKFVLALLPFYVNLRIYSFFISLLAGLVSACLYRYTIFRLRQKFTKRRRERVLTIGASAVLLLISSAVFAIGIRFIDTVWVSRSLDCAFVWPVCLLIVLCNLSPLLTCSFTFTSALFIRIGISISSAGRLALFPTSAGWRRAYFFWASTITNKSCSNRLRLAKFGRKRKQWRSIMEMKIRQLKAPISP